MRTGRVRGSIESKPSRCPVERPSITSGKCHMHQSRVTQSIRSAFTAAIYEFATHRIRLRPRIGRLLNYYERAS